MHENNKNSRKRTKTTLSVNEASFYLGVSKSKIYKLLKNNRLPVLKNFTPTRIKRKEFFRTFELEDPESGGGMK
ncbi:MAG: helix-turn-helix domain-containing protein [Lentisphaeria bacterium]|nr:helix-turn-helix domain-containing protein [Lentisphaeria bacterium]